MSERRFNEAEVAAIFERATDAQQSGRRPTGASEGMTLAELQDIGREVGISPELINEAAQVVERTPRAARRTFLGMPLGVERTVNLGRKLTDDEWEQFVVDLRETFDAKGTMRQEGSLRSWSNGNLQALLEPTSTGHRIRFRTMKGDAAIAMVGGVAMFGFAATALVAAAFKGALGDTGFLMATGSLATMGLAMFASTAFRLPTWARTRGQQMEDLAARLAAVAKSSPPKDSPDQDPRRQDT